MYTDILLPVDLTHASERRQSHEVAIEYAQAFGSTLHVMTVVPDSGMAIVSQYFSTTAVDDIVEKTNEKLHEFTDKHFPKDVKIQHVVTTGNVYESIITTAEKIDCDLIIMSAHRPELKDYLLGPNSARVVRHSNKSVLVVRS